MPRFIIKENRKFITVNGKKAICWAVLERGGVKEYIFRLCDGGMKFSTDEKGFCKSIPSLSLKKLY